MSWLMLSETMCSLLVHSITINHNWFWSVYFRYCSIWIIFCSGLPVLAKAFSAFNKSQPRGAPLLVSFLFFKLVSDKFSEPSNLQLTVHWREIFLLDFFILLLILFEKVTAKYSSQIFNKSFRFFFFIFLKKIWLLINFIIYYWQWGIIVGGLMHLQCSDSKHNPEVSQYFSRVIVNLELIYST